MNKFRVSFYLVELCQREDFLLPFSLSLTKYMCYGLLIRSIYPYCNPKNLLIEWTIDQDGQFD